MSMSTSTSTSTSTLAPAAIIQAARERLAVVPDDPGALIQLGTGLLLAGEVAQAIPPLELAVAQLTAPPVGVLLNLGAAYLMTDANERAQPLYQRVLARDPANINALNNLGALALEADAPERAQRYLARCLAVAPQHRDAIINLARAERALGRRRDAIARLLPLANQPPDRADVLAELAIALVQEGSNAYGLAAAERAIRADPAHRGALEAIVIAQAGLGRADLALPHARRALSLDSTDAVARGNLVMVLQALGHIGEALTLLDEADAAGNNTPALTQLRAVCLFTAGRYRDGTAPYRARFAVPGTHGVAAKYPLPPDTTPPPPSTRVGLWGEQGVGDQIMFCSCLPPVIARHPTLAVAVDGRLAPLLQARHPTIAVLSYEQMATGDGWSDRDYLAPLGDVLGWADPVGKTSALALPASAKAAPHRPAVGPTVALSWASYSPRYGQRKSPPVAALAKLDPAGAFGWLPVQHAAPRADLDQLARAFAGRWHPPTGLDPHQDLVGLGATMAAATLVLSVSNVTAHLAAALGLETWIMLAHGSDWRWGHGETAPWYPRVRLFRQPVPGDWDSVMAAINQALVERLS